MEFRLLKGRKCLQLSDTGGIFLANSGPTLAKKLLNLFAIRLGSEIMVLLHTISSINLSYGLLLDVIEFNIFHVLARLSFTLCSFWKQ